MERTASFTVRAKRLHVDHIAGRRVRCFVRVFLKQSDATTFAQHSSCLGPRICCPNSNQAFPATTRHQNRICGTELEDYLYLYLKRLSLPLCFQGTTVRDDCLCAWVFWGMMSVGCGSVILQVAHGGLACRCPITPRHVHLQDGL